MTTTSDKIQRLNYIGSKFQLLEWIEMSILEKTGWEDFNNKRIADLFSGTGVISHHFRKKGAITISNDAELYSYVITHALSISTYNNKIASWIQKINAELNEGLHLQNEPQYITLQYSPRGEKGRMFFTEDNARRIDYIRNKIEEDKEKNNNLDDNIFLLATLILAADAVSNVPAVYGCFLKNFKAKAEKKLTLVPIHTMTIVADKESQVYQSDILHEEFLNNLSKVDIAYLDPPYNQRQYSKNYFPLNMIALNPTQQLAEGILKGKTGIPESCFVSPFCKKRDIKLSLEKMINNVNAEWVVLSYSSEGLLSKEEIMELMQKKGEVSIVERVHKRFKSFEYNDDGTTFEYLFILHK